MMNEIYLQIVKKFNLNPEIRNTNYIRVKGLESVDLAKWIMQEFNNVYAEPADIKSNKTYSNFGWIKISISKRNK